ncbi:hypothetical protein [Microvirga mediterraneensis]|uniref:Uncharacterized protein n=1 Tax=Microvirga mediterraneensis TaxID=2754695 RepID=A0A838BWQ3_9HYPH|nr:hypothetical protein [Microvirga mediterraneensis]MBA1158956.1 hypothetical protein [Microvirga mediterraneensis]
MTTGYFFVKLRGADDVSGIVLQDTGDRDALLRQGAELLSHLHAAPVRLEDVELVPYFPPQSEALAVRRPNQHFGLA